MLIRKQRGFTLIELLVVIAIIAILAAILFPVFTAAKRNGQKAACVNNLRQLGSALTMYLDDSGGRIPYATRVGRGWTKLEWDPGDGESPERFARDVVQKKEVGVFRNYVKNGDVWCCPTFANPKSVICSYAGQKIRTSDNFTTYAWISKTWSLKKNIWDHYMFLLSISDIPRPARQPAFIEIPYAAPGAHNGSSNALYYDGHVKAMAFMHEDYWSGDLYSLHSHDGWPE